MRAAYICSWTSDIKGIYLGRIRSFEGYVSFANKLFPWGLHNKMSAIYIENTDKGHLPHCSHTSLTKCLLHRGVAQACRNCKSPTQLLTFTFSSPKMRKLRNAMRCKAQLVGVAERELT